VFEAEQVVVCAAYASTNVLNTFALPLNALRGQVTWGYEDELPPTVAALLPPFPINGMGSLVRGHEAHTGRAFWMVGSTFVRGQTSTDIRAEEHQDNLDKLKQLLPKLGNVLEQAVDTASGQAEPPIDHSAQPALEATLHGWAAVRCTVPDRLPLVGAVSPQTHPGLHVLTGLGARGLTLSVLCGELLAALIDEAGDLGRASQTLNVQEPGLLKNLVASRMHRKQPV
jgi:tRNA 5-methylaminomethyl-2-thiouridine biosynthesis bifunctional protein